MIWLRIAAVAVVFLAAAVQITYVYSLRKRVDALEARPEAQSATPTEPTRRHDWSELPSTTHCWEVTEDDGAWSWEVRPLTHRWFHRYWMDGVPPRPTTEKGDPVASGTTKSRKAAERAIQRWFWREHKAKHTPAVNAMRASGEWSVR